MRFQVTHGTIKEVLQEQRTGMPISEVFIFISFCIRQSRFANSIYSIITILIGDDLELLTNIYGYSEEFRVKVGPRCLRLRFQNNLNIFLPTMLDQSFDQLRVFITFLVDESVAPEDHILTET
jgi:hypothetical protein